MHFRSFPQIQLLFYRTPPGTANASGCFNSFGRTRQKTLISPSSAGHSLLTTLSRRFFQTATVSTWQSTIQSNPEKNDANERTVSIAPAVYAYCGIPAAGVRGRPWRDADPQQHDLGN